MKIKAHPRFSAIRRELIEHRENLLQPVCGRFFRCVRPRYARPDVLLDGQGTRRHGGRWMPPDQERAVSLASTDLLAVKETRHKQESFQVPMPQARARLLIPIFLNLTRVCDLTKIPEESTWLRWDELLREDWTTLNDTGRESLSQALGRAVFSLGYEALLAFSARDRRARNITFFPENLSPDSTTRIEDAEELDRWLRPT